MELNLMDIDRKDDATNKLNVDFGYDRGNPSITEDISIVLNRVSPSEQASTVRGPSNRRNNRKRSESGRQRYLRRTSLAKAPDSEVQRPTVYNNGENKMILCSITDLFSVSYDVCVMCGAFGAGQEGCLIACVQCGQCYHPYCVNIKVSRVILEKGWRCLHCTVCEGCGLRTDESRLVLCDDCDISYHIYCMDPKLEAVPQGNWKCKWCARCQTCGADEPGVSCSWSANFTECGPCSSRLTCPVCRCSYSDDDRIIKCDLCQRWLHCNCDWFSPVKCSKGRYTCVLCRPIDHPPSYLTLPPPTPRGGKVTKNKKPTFVAPEKQFVQDGTCVSEEGFFWLPRLLNNAKAAESYSTRRYTSAVDSEYLDQSVFGGTECGIAVDAKGGRPTSSGNIIVCNEHAVIESEDAKTPESTESFHVIARNVDVPLKRKRFQKLGLGVGGFTTFIRSTKLKQNVIEDTMEKNLSGEEASPSASDLSANGGKFPKKKKSKQLESQLTGRYPSDIQTAFFGHGLLNFPKCPLDDPQNNESDSNDTYSRRITRAQSIKLSQDGLETAEKAKTKLETEEKSTEKSEPMARPKFVKLEIIKSRKAMKAAEKAKNPIKSDSLPGTAVNNDSLCRSDDEVSSSQKYISKPQKNLPSSVSHQSNSPCSDGTCSPKMSLDLSQSPGRSMPGTISEPIVLLSKTEQRIQRAREDEALGLDSTIPMVLFSNTDHPELKTECPVWMERYRQIQKRWRTLSPEKKQPFLKGAIENRRKLSRDRKAQKTQLQSPSVDISEPFVDHMSGQWTSSAELRSFPISDVPEEMYSEHAPGAASKEVSQFESTIVNEEKTFNLPVSEGDAQDDQHHLVAGPFTTEEHEIPDSVAADLDTLERKGVAIGNVCDMTSIFNDLIEDELFTNIVDLNFLEYSDPELDGLTCGDRTNILQDLMNSAVEPGSKKIKEQEHVNGYLGLDIADSEAVESAVKVESQSNENTPLDQILLESVQQEKQDQIEPRMLPENGLDLAIPILSDVEFERLKVDVLNSSVISGLTGMPTSQATPVQQMSTVQIQSSPVPSSLPGSTIAEADPLSHLNCRQWLERQISICEERKKFFEKEITALSNAHEEMLQEQLELRRKGDDVPERDVEELSLISTDIAALSKLCLITRSNIEKYAALIKDEYPNGLCTKTDAFTSAVPASTVAFSIITPCNTVNVMSGQEVQGTSLAASLFDQECPTSRFAGSVHVCGGMCDASSNQDAFHATCPSSSTVTSQMQLCPRPQAPITSQQSGDLVDASSRRSAFHATIQPPSTATSRMQLNPRFQQLIVRCPGNSSIEFVGTASELQQFLHHAPRIPSFPRCLPGTSITPTFLRPRQPPSQFPPILSPRASPASSRGLRHAFQPVPGARPSSTAPLPQHVTQFACPPNADWSPQSPTSPSSSADYSFQFVRPTSPAPLARSAIRVARLKANASRDDGSMDTSSTSKQKCYNNGHCDEWSGGNVSFTNVTPVPEEFARLGIKPGLLGGAPARTENDDTTTNGSEAVTTSAVESEGSMEISSSESAPPPLNLPEDARAEVNSSSTSSEPIVSCLDAAPMLLEIGNEPVADEHVFSSVNVDGAEQASISAAPCMSIDSSTLSPDPMPVEINEQPTTNDVDASILMNAGLAVRPFLPTVTLKCVEVNAEHTENGQCSLPTVDARTFTNNFWPYSPSESLVTNTNVSPAAVEIKKPLVLIPRVGADVTIPSCVGGALSSSPAHVEMKTEPLTEALASVPWVCDTSTVADSKNDETSNGSLLDVEGLKKPRKRLPRKRKQRVKENSPGAPEKRIREVFEKHEDGHDSFVDNAFAEQPKLALIEPVVRCNYSMCLPFGAGDPQEVSVNTWENGQLHGTYGSFTLPGEVDYYNTHPFGDEEPPTLVWPAALDFYDMYIPPPSVGTDSGDARTRRPDSVVSILSSTSSEGCSARIPHLAGLRLDDSEEDERQKAASPPIPLVMPLAQSLCPPDTLPSCEDVPVILTLTFQAARRNVSVMENLGTVLHCAPSTSYEITERLSNLTTNPPGQLNGDKEAGELLKYVDDSTKRCHYCRTAVFDFVQKKASELPLAVHDNVSENLFFCSTSCYLQTMLLISTLEKFEENDFPMADSNSRRRGLGGDFDIAAPAVGNKSGLSTIDRMGSKHLSRHRTWTKNSIPFPAQHLIRRPTESELIKMLFEMNMTVRPSEMPEDRRRCVFCDEVGDGVGDGPSRLLNYDVDKWAHLNCTLWSDVVYETLSGSLMNVSMAVRYAARIPCSFCNKHGATVKCCKLRCPSIYHLPCALKVDCVFFENKAVFCASHAPLKTEFGELNTLAVRRKVFIPQDGNQKIASIVQPFELTEVLRIGALILLNVGQLPPHRLREFHNANFIYPIGYQMVRFYWSMRAFNKRCQYRCSIHDVAGRPEFRILVREPGHEDVEFRDATAKAVWTRVLAPLTELRNRHRSVRLYPAYISGEDLFGLTEPTIARILENLPGTERLDRYRFKYDKDPVLRSTLATNPSGCARCEPKQPTGLARKRARLQRTDSVVPRPVGAGDETYYLDPKRVVCPAPSQYIKMAKEWRNQVYLARSKIHGLGLFAARDFSRSSMVVEYVGEAISLRLSKLRRKQYEAKNRAIYMFRLDEHRVVDATMRGNLARYINHSCDPNCVTKTIKVDQKYHIVVYARQKITYGEELTYSYRFDDENDVEEMWCLCGAEKCRNWVY